MRLIIGISGSTGAIYGVRLLETLKWLGIESHLVMSKSAEMTIGYEIEMQPADVKALADTVYPIGDLGAPISSGSFPITAILSSASALVAAHTGVIRLQRNIWSGSRPAFAASFRIAS